MGENVGGCGQRHPSRDRTSTLHQPSSNVRAVRGTHRQPAQESGQGKILPASGGHGSTERRASRKQAEFLELGVVQKIELTAVKLVQRLKTGQAQRGHGGRERSGSPSKEAHEDFVSRKRTEI